MFQQVGNDLGVNAVKSSGLSAIAFCIGAIAFSILPASADEPFKENGKVYIGGFVPGETVTVIYENLSFAKDFRADPCGTIRLKSKWPSFHFYSTVNINGVPINVNNLNPLEYWTGNPAQFVRNRYSCSNGVIKDDGWRNRWKFFGGLKAVSSSVDSKEMWITGLGYSVVKVTTDAAPPRRLKANSCGFITLSSSDRWPLTSFYFYTANTDPSSSYSLSSLPEQPALLCRQGVFYRPAQ
jgi:hypothetical protein